MPLYWTIADIEGALRPPKDAKAEESRRWEALVRVLEAVQPPYIRPHVVLLIQAWANAPWHRVRWGQTRWGWKRKALRELRDYQRAHALPFWEPGKLNTTDQEWFRRFNEAMESGKRPDVSDLTREFGFGAVDLRPEMSSEFPPPAYKHLDDIRWENPPIQAVGKHAAIDGMTADGIGRPTFEEVSRHWWTDRNATAVVLMEHLKKFSGSYHHRDLADILSVFTPESVSDVDLKNLTDRHADKIAPAVARLFPRPKVARKPRKKSDPPVF